MIVITDERIKASSLSALYDLRFDVILVPPAKHLQAAVASHTDMLIFIGFGKLFCHKSYFLQNKNIIKKISDGLSLEVIPSDEPTGKEYPNDVLFNACLLGDKLICNERTVSKLILNAAKEVGAEIITVPQGYTKCSIAVVSENAIITADKATEAACRSRGIDVLSVSEGHVSLPPYNFGFIGGASGAHSNTVYFCGSLDSHPDCEKIVRFCEKHKKSVLSLGNDKLQDVGSLFFFE